MDRDTAGKPGTPEIPEVIFKKIATSNIFVADVTIINGKEKERRTPNPNVLLELGFAAGVLGWENIFCVYNEGISPVEELPFDLKFRRPVIYNCDDSETETSKVKLDLINKLTAAISAIDFHSSERIKEIKRVFNLETDKAQQLAINKPDSWNALLVAELIRFKTQPIKRGLDDLRNELLFKKTRLIDGKVFFEWYQISVDNFRQFYSIIERIFNTDLPVAQKNNDAIEIKNGIDKALSACKELFEWEIELKSLRVPEEFQEIKDLLQGASEQSIDQIASIATQTEEVFRKPEIPNPVTIRISVVFPQGLAKALELFRIHLPGIQG